MPSNDQRRTTNGDLSSLLVETDDDRRVTVLVVDDDPDILDLTATFLERERDEFDVITEAFADDALARLETDAIDAVVSDYDMPRMDGLAFLEAVRETDEDLPFILFTGMGSEAIAGEAISKGVTDYLEKRTDASQYSILANRLHNAVEQYRAATALSRSEELFSKLVTNSTDVIGVVDENARFKYISPTCTQTLGYEQDELLGECAFDYMPPDDRKNAMEAFYAGIENPDHEPVIEFRFERPDDGWTVVEARGKNCFDDDAIAGYVVTVRDITELKKREQELRQQNERLTDMRKMVAHDLREPLNAASGFMDLYREERDEATLDKAANALDRLRTLLDQTITLADNDASVGETERVSLQEIVRSAWETIDHERATLQVDDSREFEVDPSRFEQVAQNLLGNAIAHSDGDVTVCVGTTDSRIYFEDTGPGISPEERERVFESGYTTDPTGNGFGLTIVKQVVLGHGWDIEAVDGEDGARFEIRGVSFEPVVYT